MSSKLFSEACVRSAASAIMMNAEYDVLGSLSPHLMSSHVGL